MVVMQIRVSVIHIQDVIKKMKKRIEFNCSSVCNLRCAYCFLHKNKAYEEEDKNIVQSLKDGSFIKNICFSLEKMNINKSEFDSFSLWGGETSYHLDLLAPHMRELLERFPNINMMQMSTNMAYSAQNFIQFIDTLIEICDKPFKFNIQISLDGPDSILSKTRFIEYSKIKTQLMDIINYYNGKKMKNVCVDFFYKTTISFDILKEICKTQQSKIDFFKFFRDELLDIRENIFNPNMSFSHDTKVARVAPVAPENYTIQDGIDLARMTREFDAIDWAKMGFTEGSGANLPVMLFDAQEAHERPYQGYSNCGQGTEVFNFRWDGSIGPCPSAFMEDNEKYLEEVKEKDFSSYQHSLYLKKWYMYPNKPEVTKEQLQKQINLKKTLWKDNKTFIITQIINLMYDMAECGQISPCYKRNLDLITDHAFRVFEKTGCFYYNIKVSGSPLLPQLSVIRLLCNGFLEYSDIRGKYI